MVADQGFMSAQSCAAQMSKIYGNATQAVKYSKLAADQGHVRSMIMLGEHYLSGNGVEKNVKKGKAYLRKAAENNNGPEFLIQIASLLYKYDGNKYTEEIFKYLKLAADLGNVNGQLHAGRCYEEGKVVIGNKAEAFRYYKLAAEQGNACAQEQLSMCYFHGSGIEANAQLQYQYAMMAADQDSGVGQYMVGACLLKGHGVDKNVELAKEYFQKAAKNGQPTVVIEDSNN